MIVRASTQLASVLNIPIFIVGLVIISIGTTLPELSLSFESLKKHQVSIFLGNVLGSIIANATLVVGLAAVITPIKIMASSGFLPAAAFYIVIFIVFYHFTKTKHRLDRWEAAVLLILYFSFVAAELL